MKLIDEQTGSHNVKNEFTQLSVINRMESNVRGYVRSFPTVFKSAVNAHVVDAEGRRYIDFFAGAGTLNYGHNNRLAKQALLNYLTDDGLMHGLDLATTAKIEFLETFDRVILKPRNLSYKIQFTGPTGANAVEAAVKLARKAKQRSHVISFTNGYHGHSLGALSLTGNQYYHNDLFGSRSNVSFMPFDNYFEDGANTALQLRKLLQDNSSGIPIPAAIILETVQAEGGINVASASWLQEIRSICTDFDITLIVDDIQTGNGRTGEFFSFEAANIVPDIVCISKSIGGGLPLAMILISAELDLWEPGEHTGTFRGNQLAFVAAKELIQHWEDDTFRAILKHNCQASEAGLQAIASEFDGVSTRGRGMIRGLVMPSGDLAKAVTERCFQKGLIIETAGAEDQVVKFLAPLTIEKKTLEEGLSILRSCVADVIYSGESKKRGLG